MEAQLGQIGNVPAENCPWSLCSHLSFTACKDVSWSLSTDKDFLLGEETAKHSKKNAKLTQEKWTTTTKKTVWSFPMFVVILFCDCFFYFYFYLNYLFVYWWGVGRGHSWAARSHGLFHHFVFFSLHFLTFFIASCNVCIIQYSLLPVMSQELWPAKLF